VRGRTVWPKPGTRVMVDESPFLRHINFKIELAVITGSRDRHGIRVGWVIASTGSSWAASPCIPRQVMTHQMPSALESMSSLSRGSRVKTGTHRIHCRQLSKIKMPGSSIGIWHDAVKRAQFFCAGLPATGRLVR